MYVCVGFFIIIIILNVYIAVGAVLYIPRYQTQHFKMRRKVYPIRMMMRYFNEEEELVGEKKVFQSNRNQRIRSIIKAHLQEIKTHSKNN